MEDISINKSKAERSICWHGKTRDFPGGSAVKTSPSNRGGASSLPGGGARIPYVSRPKNQNTEQKQPCNEFSKDFKIGPHQIILKKKKARADKLNDINTHSTLSTDAGNYFNNYVIKKACPSAQMHRIIAIKLACLIVTVVKVESPFRAKELTVESLRDSASLRAGKATLYITHT